MTNDVFQHYVLNGIVLWEASVTRGDGDADSPGRMDNQGHIDGIDVSGEAARFWIGVKSTFVDESDEPILIADVTYVAEYGIADGHHPDERELQAFVSHGVLFQLHPYLRETISSLTSRAGLPAALLPILLHGTDDDDDENVGPAITAARESSQA